MMGVSVADARGLSLWEYEALLTEWNARHPSDDDDDEVEAPDWAMFRENAAKIPAAYLN